MSIIFLWQKHEALKSTCSWSGNTIIDFNERLGKNENYINIIMLRKTIWCSINKVYIIILNIKVYDKLLFISLILIYIIIYIFTNRYCNNIEESSTLWKTPFVIWVACCKKTVSSSKSLQTSIGIFFIMIIYILK